MLDNLFEQRSPADQNAIDIFRGRWAGMIEEVHPGVVSGQMRLFSVEDNRPILAAQNLGYVPGSLQGMRVLELGPLEGAHTYQLSGLGAESVLAIEASSEAYLKCLIVKELLGIPRCRFLFGDCTKYLNSTPGPFDMIFCSGILYHMQDPFELIQAISKNTDRVFIYTHYYNSLAPFETVRKEYAVVRDNLNLTYYERDYGDKNSGHFLGGNKPTAAWLSREDIERIFLHFGFDLAIHEDNAQFSWIKATAKR